MSFANPSDGPQNLSEGEQQIYEAVKDTLEENGGLKEIRANIQKKVFEVIRGDGAKSGSPRVNERDPRIQLVNQLIMQYFHWYGYMYTIEMFGVESGTDTTCPPPQFLESRLANRQYKSHVLPILIELVMDLMEKK